VLQEIQFPLKILLAILSYFVFDSFADMRKYQISTPSPNDVSMMERLNVYKSRFLAERNFYLFSFTLALFLIIMRVQRMLQNYNKLKLRSKQREKEFFDATAKLSAQPYHHPNEPDTFRVGALHPSDEDPLVADIRETSQAEARRRD